MLAKTETNFNHVGIIKLIETVNTQCFKADYQFYTNPPKQAYLSEEVIQKTHNPDQIMQMFFWLKRIQRYFLFLNDGDDPDGQPNTIRLIEAFLNNLQQFPEVCQQYLCRDPQALNCLVFSLLVSREELLWTQIIALIEQHHPEMPSLPLLEWCKVLYHNPNRDVALKLMPEVAKLFDQGPGSTIPNSLVSSLFQYTGISTFYVEKEEEFSSSSLRILLPTNLTMDSPAVFPYLIQLGVQVEAISHSFHYFNYLTADVIKEFLRSFQPSAGPGIGHHCLEYNTREFVQFLEYFVVTTLKQKNLGIDPVESIGLSRMMRFLCDKGVHSLNIGRLGQTVLHLLVRFEEFQEAEGFFNDLFMQTYGFKNDVENERLCGLFCYLNKINEWLNGPHELPKFTANEYKLINSFRFIDKELAHKFIADKQLFDLALEVAQRFQDVETRSNTLKKQYNQYIDLFTRLLTNEQAKEVTRLFNRSKPKKIVQQPPLIVEVTAPPQKDKTKAELQIPESVKTQQLPNPEFEAPLPSDNYSVNDDDDSEVIENEAFAVEDIEDEDVSVASSDTLSSTSTNEETDDQLSNGKTHKPKLLPKKAKKISPHFVKLNLDNEEGFTLVTSHKKDSAKSTPKPQSESKQDLPKKPTPWVRPTSVSTVLPVQVKGVNHKVTPPAVSTKTWSKPENDLSKSVNSRFWPKPQAQVLQEGSVHTFFGGATSSTTQTDLYVLRTKIPERILRLIDELRQFMPATEFYLVGASVADILSGQKPHDYDFVVINTNEDELQSFLRIKGLSSKKIGIKFPIIYCNLGKRIGIDFTVKFKVSDEDNQKILFNDFCQRDFNGSSLYCELTSENQFLVFSFKGALQTYNQGVIATNIEPYTALVEDPLRLFRLIKMMIKNPKAVLVPELHYVLDSLKGRYHHLFSYYVGMDLGNKSRLSGVLNKLFTRFSLTKINEEMDRLGLLFDLTGNTLAEANLACAKIVSANPEGKFLLWLAANLLQVVSRTAVCNCPLRSFISLKHHEKEILNFVQAKAAGIETQVIVSDADVLKLVKQFDLPRNASSQARP